MLNTYKHLQNLKFVSCLLNNQQQEPALISINTVPSVSYCSTVMLCAVFDCLCSVYFIMCVSQYITERIWSFGRSRKIYRIVGGVLGGGVDVRGSGQPTLKLNTFLYSSKGCLCKLTLCNYKYLNNRLFPSSAVFYNFICHESDWQPARWRWSIFPSCNIRWFNFAACDFQNLLFWKCDNDRRKVASADRIVFNIVQHIVILSATINCTLLLHYQLLLVT